MGLALVAAGWLIPPFLPSTLIADMLKPTMPEFVDIYVPEVLSAMQVAFGASGVVVVSCFATWVLVTSVGARPAGPGEVGGGWRKVLWWILLLVTLGLTYAVVTYQLTWQLDVVDGASATRVAVIAMAAAAAAYWLISFFGVERMMRPAVPLASLR